MLYLLEHSINIMLKQPLLLSYKCKSLYFFFIHLCICIHLAQIFVFQKSIDLHSLSRFSEKHQKIFSVLASEISSFLTFIFIFSLIGFFNIGPNTPPAQVLIQDPRLCSTAEYSYSPTLADNALCDTERGTLFIQVVLYEG